MLRVVVGAARRTALQGSQIQITRGLWSFEAPAKDDDLHRRRDPHAKKIDLTCFDEVLFVSIRIYTNNSIIHFMCGIFCSLSRHRQLLPPEQIQKALHARGPDATSQICTELNADSTTHHGFVTLYSTVLSLRGSSTVQQPYVRSESSSALCWNGEAWSIAGQQPDGNDTARIWQLLEKATKQQVPLMDARDELAISAQNIADAMAQVAGPYAFVFHDTRADRIYFGRDFLGRRSLLRQVTSEGDVLLSSVSDGVADAGWTEVEADGIYCLDVSRRSYGRDRPCDDTFERWGNHFVAKTPYKAHDKRSLDTKSVIPKLSLNREIPTHPKAITEHSASVLELEALLTESLLPRIMTIPEPPVRADEEQSCDRAKIAILFSGGLDCTMLARLSHNLLPTSEPIDLLNVAFENPRIHKSRGEESYELCPDRVTARSSYAELCAVCPERQWRLILINIPYTETLEHRQHIIDLMHPHNTEMDLSIACALYFAARGRGNVESKGQSPLPYTTSARVLLSGLGADELFAGYTRHATAYNRAGFTGLLDELDLDIGRLGKRNLGRDDRVISNWSKEVRFPFLDEQLVESALSTPVTDKCDFRAVVEEVGVKFDGDHPTSIEPGKKVLRCLAWKLGMKLVAREKKRAIQFGARTAKMETGKTKGTTLLS